MNNYVIIDPHGHRVRIRRAVYDPTTHTVTLHPFRRLNVHYGYKLTVFGAGLGGVSNTQGRLLDGKNTGTPGSNYHAIVNRKNLVWPKSTSKVGNRLSASTVHRPIPQPGHPTSHVNVVPDFKLAHRKTGVNRESPCVKGSFLSLDQEIAMRSPSAPSRQKIRRARKSAYRPDLESMEARRLMAVITVTGTGDAINATDGVVTLREAITAANGNKNISDVVGVGAYGADTIAFDIPGSGVHTIAPTSPLPIITDPVTIDGYTQPGSAPNTNPVGQGLNGNLLIEIDGENAGNVRFGMINIETGDSTVRGLVINRTQGVKIGLNGSTGNNLIEGNYLGTDTTGTMSFPGFSTGSVDRVHGVSMETVGNTIGGTTPAARNLISGNTGSSDTTGAYGIRANGSFPANIDTFVQGNLIGTDVTGTKALGNGSGGVLAISPNLTAGNVIVGGPEAGAGNVISGNGGFGVRSRNGVVQGNFIGTDVTGTLALGNNDGVEISGNVTLAQNTIAFNANRRRERHRAYAGRRRHRQPHHPQLDLLERRHPAQLWAVTGPRPQRPLARPRRHPELPGPQLGRRLRRRDAGARGPRQQAQLELPPGVLRQQRAGRKLLEFPEQPRAAGPVRRRPDVPRHDRRDNRREWPRQLHGQPPRPAERPAVRDRHRDRHHRHRLGPAQQHLRVLARRRPGRAELRRDQHRRLGGLGSLREAIFNANLTPGAQTITFAIPATDPRHFYYRNDGVAGQVSQADIAVTTATSDANIADIDPDWAHSWFSILPSHDLPQIVDTVTIDGYSQPGSVANTLPALGAVEHRLEDRAGRHQCAGHRAELGHRSTCPATPATAGSMGWRSTASAATGSTEHAGRRRRDRGQLHRHGRVRVDRPRQSAATA